MPPPIFHLEAETWAVLLGEEVAFRRALTELDPELRGATGAVWRAAEPPLCALGRGLSLDGLVALRDKLWFPQNAGGGAASVPLDRVVRTFARPLLTDCGAEARPSTPNNSPSGLDDSIRRWRWYTYAVPADLILAAAFSDGPLRVEAIEPLIRRSFSDQGYAEVHLHLGAAMEFPLFWLSTLRRLRMSGFHRDALASPGAPFDEGRDLLSWLLSGAIGRLLLADFLISRRITKKAGGFADFLDAEVRTLGKIAGGSVGQDMRNVFSCLIAPPPSGPPFTSFGRLFGLYARLWPRPHRIPNCLDQAWKLDPVNQLSGVVWPRDLIDLHLMREGFAYLSSKQDSLFAQVFWQVVRLRTILYRYVTQRPAIAGLQWFLRFYDRSRYLREPLRKILVESAFETDGGREGLRSLEVRTIPDNEVGKLRKDLGRRILGSWIRTTRPKEAEFGVVLHIPRDRGGGASQGRPAAFWANPSTIRGGSAFKGRRDPFRADPSANLGGYRFANYYRKWQKAIFAIEQLLRRDPLMIWLIRGFDVCADELGVPNWVMAPLIQRLTLAGENAAVRLARTEWKAAAPRLTAHVGEDFRSLMEGLRRVDETIDSFKLISGDRLGHAVALGFSPQRWAASYPVIRMPREERLWDLLWERSWYQQGATPVSAVRLAHIEREAEEHADTIFRSSNLSMLWKVRQALHQPARLTGRLGARFPNGPIPALGSQSWSGILIRYLTDRGVFLRSFEPVEVSMAGEVEALVTLQQAMLKKVAGRRLSIEANPSSNQLIADLGEIEHHPLWRLDPPQSSLDGKDNSPRLSVCIGADNPLTFATNLRQEYEMLYDVLIEKGVGEIEARQYLDRVRRNGMDARFTLPSAAGVAGFPWQDLQQSGPTRRRRSIRRRSSPSA
jgi:hypothetical protein